MNAKTCPVIVQTRDVLQSARHFSAAMRRLRKAMRQCRVCPERAACPVLIRFDAQLQEALAEVVISMGLRAGEDGV